MHDTSPWHARSALLARTRGQRAAAVGFAALLAAAAPIAPTTPIAHGEEAGRPVLYAGPFVGEVGPDRAALWCYPGLEAKASVEVALAPVPDPARPDAPAPNERRVAMARFPDGMGSYTARIDGLLASTTYAYRILVEGRSDADSSGTFRTAPPDGAPTAFKLVPVSCMKPHVDRVQGTWARVAEEAPDLLLLLGDNHYADKPQRTPQWAQHLSQRTVPSFAAIVRQTPTLAIWDDHDYGANNSDGTLVDKEQSLAIFREVFPNPSYGLPETPGVFCRARWGDVDIFLLDGRYHRSPNFALPTPRKSVLGAEQFAWLERELTASTATFKIVACGSTLNANPRDGWFLFRHERERLFDLFARVGGVLFLSGDLHSSRFTEHDLSPYGGTSLPEVISSGVALGRAKQSFAALAIDTTAADPTIRVSIIETDRVGRQTGRRTFEVRRSALGGALSERSDERPGG